jgi:hypothetical protein
VGTIGISLNPKGIIGYTDMGCVVGTSGDRAEIARIQQLSADEAGLPGFALPHAIGPAKGAQT